MVDPSIPTPPPNGESSAVTVFMRVGDPSGPGDAGLVFVELLDASRPDEIRLGADDIADRDFLIGYRPDILAAQAAGAPSAIERMRLRP